MAVQVRDIQPLPPALPPEVERIRVERGEDASGDPAAYLYVILRDGRYDGRDQRWFAAIADAVATHWAESDPTVRPYVFFRTHKEQALVDADRL